MFAVAKSAPNVVITVASRVAQGLPPDGPRGNRDRRVAVQVLRGAVAQRQRVVPEQFVEHGDVVADERGFVALERRVTSATTSGRLISTSTIVQA